MGGRLTWHDALLLALVLVRPDVRSPIRDTDNAPHWVEPSVGTASPLLCTESGTVGAFSQAGEPYHWHQREQEETA